MLESTKEGLTGLPEGSDIGLGPGDRAFEPHYSDQNPSEIVDFRGIFLFFDSASATERTQDFCGLFPLHIAKYAANRCIYSTNLSIPFCTAPL